MTSTPLVNKLRIKENQMIAVINSPPGYQNLLVELPEGVQVYERLEGSFDLIQAFFSNSEDLSKQIKALKDALKVHGILWISYQKISAKQDSDLNRDILRELLAEINLKAVSLISINDTWSAMRFKRL
jgi:hypothetical protein